MYKITLYRNREKSRISSINILKNLKTREKIEKSIVFHNVNKLNFHNKKWDAIIDILNR